MPDRDTFDLLVVGGGINGAGIARDAAGRGLSVALCEQADLANYTSSASTKLIHGGLRYLEHYEFALVRKSLQERERLLTIAPHIIWPLRFVLPHVRDLRPYWMIRAGLLLYDHLAGRGSLPRSQGIDLATHAAGAPLDPALRKGLAYFDCWVQDARLVLLNALDAAERGARIWTRTRCVAAARRRALPMADMPFMSYTDRQQALHNAGRLMKEGGAHMVKLEGAGDQAEVVAALAAAGVPVCAHLGLQPQLVHKMGGYRVQGKDTAAASRMLHDAQKLQDAGADLLLVECIPASLGGALASRLDIPVVGIGAGPSCDGQILVLQDMLGITPGRLPSFASDFMDDASTVPEAVQAYVRAVKRGQFPSEEHCF
jgi:3-methyl-2-oxobutanoate hydroxymethyltransferase